MASSSTAPATAATTTAPSTSASTSRLNNEASASASSTENTTTKGKGPSNEDEDAADKRNGNADASAATAAGQASTSSFAAPNRQRPEVPREPDGIIDMEIIGQVFEMDDLEDEEEDGEGEDQFGFSKGIVWNYFEQAEATFVNMKEALAAKDLSELSKLGHFLKGSSAALGIIKVKDSCERMQHYGNKRDEEANRTLTAQEALDKIRDLLQQVQEEYDEAEEWLKRYYREQESGGGGDGDEA